MTLNLDNNELTISKKMLGSTIIVEHAGQKVSVLNDTIDRTTEIIKSNYATIKNFYIANLNKNHTDNNIQDLSEICLKILLHYLDQYSRWKEQYKKSTYDIKFYEKDFYHPTTMDLIVFYFKAKYPDSWKEISSKYLDQSLTEFETNWANRLAYHNK
jgi:hypothetical protein